MEFIDPAVMKIDAPLQSPQYIVGVPPVPGGSSPIERGRLCDTEIIRVNAEHKMIEPFVDHQVRMVGGERVISYGLSSAGYDIRCSRHFKVFTNVHSVIIDPKDFDDDAFVSMETDVCIIPPHSFVLTHSLEYFDIPRDIFVTCLGKSTYARSGVQVGITPLESGWQGYLTIELYNSTPLPVKVYAEEGCAQLLFDKITPCKTSYADRGGKYQKQAFDAVPPKV